MARKTFDIPARYHSPVIRKVKEANQITDPRKKDLSPTALDFGPVRFLIPRHFGFCYGVENAIDIAYKTIENNPDRDIYLLSEMIHNPAVNDDLARHGVEFLFETDGSERISLESLSGEDIVIVPAFGTTLEIQERLAAAGIDPYEYNTTCPFVEKVWNRGAQLGEKGYTLVVHGKHNHEETRATFSHSAAHSHVVVVLNTDEAKALADMMTGRRDAADFEALFGHKSTTGFNPVEHMNHFGVINQTTMLATETREVMQILREAAAERFGEENTSAHFADTSDTLCYATNENQSATLALADAGPDIAIVVGGYNSSNTMHLVEILESACPTYHIRDAGEITGPGRIRHFNQWERTFVETENWLPETSKMPLSTGMTRQETDKTLDDSGSGHGKTQHTNDMPLTVALTSGASCPDTLVDEVLLKILSLFPDTKALDDVIH